MNLSFSGHTKELTFKQLYEEYYAPFCLYAKRFIESEADEKIPQDSRGNNKIRNSIGIYKDVRKKQLPQFLETSGV